MRALAPSINNDVEVIVVDNDPSDDQTKQIASQYRVRYYRQARRGVNWARARGAHLAKHDLLLYVDDDVVVSSNWIDEMRRPFLNDNVGAVTGAVEPLELETSGQYDHEQFSGFYRGFDSKTYNLVTSIPAAAGQTGAGASMAVRKGVALRWKVFDAELDGGTAAKSGGDVYALYRILRAGYSVIYAPRALAWHRHRKTHTELESMLYGYSVGGYCVLFSALFRERDPEALLVSLVLVCPLSFARTLAVIAAPVPDTGPSVSLSGRYAVCWMRLSRTGDAAAGSVDSVRLWKDPQNSHDLRFCHHSDAQSSRTAASNAWNLLLSRIYLPATMSSLLLLTAVRTVRCSSCRVGKHRMHSPP